MSKKALVVISFGTTHPDARKAIEKIEDRLKAECPEYTFFRAYTSEIVLRKMKEEENRAELNPGQMMEQLAGEGYREVICQSLHVIPGYEYEKMCAQIAAHEDKFDRLEIGKPLLYENTDYFRCCRSLLAHMPKLAPDEAIVWMGHGSEHFAGASYSMLENTFRFQGAEHIYCATVEGFPNFDYVLRRLDYHKIAKVYLMPFMIVAGDHAKNDLAGDGDDSWASILFHEGYEVQPVLKGLGEYDEIGALFAAHLPK